MAVSKEQVQEVLGQLGLPGMIVLVALVSMIFILRAPYQNNLSPDWLKTDGSVAAIYADPDMSPGVQDLYGHRVVCTFNYQVAGKSFKADQDAFPNYLELGTKGHHDFRYNRTDTEKILAKYSTGKSTDVYYDPKNPGHAVVDYRK